MFLRTAHLGWCTGVALVTLSALLTACGGGSSSPPAPPPTPATLIAGTTGLDDYVQIILRPTAGGADVVFNCAADGTFSEPLAAGTYDMGATRPGYENWGEAAVVVVAEQTTIKNPNLVAMGANEYVGTPNCGACHPAELAVFEVSGHSFKLNKVIDDQIPLYPFTSIAAGLPMMDDTDDNDPADMWPGTENFPLSTPMSYADVSYVIGGYGWKARWIDKNGYIVTGTTVQYNFDLPAVPMVVPFTAATMSAYHNNESNKAYNCGNCHTTGWRHYDGPDNMSPFDFNPERQDSLTGMDGTFFAGGVHCEACHGAGSTHAQTSLAADITKVAAPLDRSAGLVSDMYYGKPHACGDCHTRDGEKDYPTYRSPAEVAGWTGANGGRIAAKGGFIRHHEQGDEILALDPNEDQMNLGTYGVPTNTRSAGFLATHGNCLTCHDQHATTKHQDNPGNTSPNGVRKTNADCLTCHATKDMSGLSSGMKVLSCIDCHMPRLVKSARSYPVQGNGPGLGDIKSHIFRINVDPAAAQFTSDGKFALPYLTATYACNKCHNSSSLGPFDFSPSAGYTFHK